VNTLEFKANKFSTTGERDEQVQTWQAKYENLLGQLSTLGTEVHVHRSLEDDKDTPPGHFIRYAVHEFVFPPQEVQLSSDDPKIIDHPINGYGLRRESRIYTYDQAAVRGHLRLNYNDSDGRIALKVTDVMADHSESELSETTVRAIDETFAWTLSTEERVGNLAVGNAN